MHYDYLYYLLNKQVSGTISDEEEKILHKWYDSLQFNSLQAAASPEEKEAAWQSLHAQMQEQGGVISLNEHRRTRWMRGWMAAAAVVLLLGLAGWWFLLPKQGDQPDALAWTTVETGPQKKSVKLPDGSMVWVNAHSRLRIAPGFLQHRQIQLDHGEAFFVVQRDSTHPFSVSMDQLSVTVLGTAFNIQHFPELSDIKVAVRHGKVRVTDSLQVRQDLITNQQMIYSRSSHKYTLDVIDPARSNDWANGNIYLKNISLKELAVYIRNIYNYEVVFKNKDLGNCKNTINFRDRDRLKDVLELLRLLNKVQYRIDNRTIYLDGAGCP